jgi:hypothetical protein
VEKQFVGHGTDSAWTLCVSYNPPDPAQTPPLPATTPALGMDVETGRNHTTPTANSLRLGTRHHPARRQRRLAQTQLAITP